MGIGIMGIGIMGIGIMGMRNGNRNWNGEWEQGVKTGNGNRE